jgi:predicted MFS family arabinose efflux permease
LGGAVTTFASWRWVFVGEVAVVVIILASARKITDTPPEEQGSFDGLGVLLSIVGLSLVVLGVLKSGEWGWLRARPTAPSLHGTSPVVWMLLGGLLVVFWFFAHSTSRVEKGVAPLVDPGLMKNRQVTGGLIMFFFQYLAQAGIFFTIPLFLSVVLELSALGTGARLLPLSAALLVAALLVPRVFRKTSPRLLVRAGLLLLIAGTVVLISGVDLDATASVVAIPMVLLGLGVGVMASQLGAITVSGAPESESTDVGGLQNTAMNLGASFGTALAGAVLIATLSTGLVGGITQSSTLSQAVKTKATTELSANVAFVSDSQLKTAMSKTSLSPADQQEILSLNQQSRIKALDTALSVILLLEAVALLFTGRLPKRPLSSTQPSASPPSLTQE